MIVGVDHMQLAMPVGGEDVAIAFYGDLLGLEQIPKPAVLAARGGCWFSTPTLQIHLGADPDFRPATKAHPAFVVDDRNALVERLTAHGVAVRDGATIDGVIQVFCDDPFGNRIELMPASS